MESTENSIKEAFEKDLKAVNYVNELDSFVVLDDALIRTPLKVLNDALKSGKFKGSRLLELGSGAVVHNIALASAFFRNIIMSDFVEDNCEELKRWLSGQSTLKQFLNIAAEVEGFEKNSEASQQLLENRIRDSVKQVVRCDVLSDPVLLEEVKPEVAPPYDLIISTYCLDTAAPDIDSLALILKRINRLLRPGGGLMLAGFFGGTPWQTAEKTTFFNYLDINEKDLRKALGESGFGNIDLTTYGRLKVDYGHDAIYCAVAERLQDHVD